MYICVYTYMYIYRYMYIFMHVYLYTCSICIGSWTRPCPRSATWPRKSHPLLVLYLPLLLLYIFSVFIFFSSFCIFLVFFCITLVALSHSEAMPAVRDVAKKSTPPLFCITSFSSLSSSHSLSCFFFFCNFHVAKQNPPPLPTTFPLS